ERHPERQLGPRLHLVLEEQVVGDPGEPRAAAGHVDAVLQQLAVARAGLRVRSSQYCSVSPYLELAARAVALNVPGVPCSPQSSRNRARSRTSTSWVGRSGSPGASTSPPRFIRISQAGRRPTFSCGPRMRPARAIVDRSPKTSVTARSQ